MWVMLMLSFTAKIILMKCDFGIFMSIPCNKGLNSMFFSIDFVCTVFLFQSIDPGQQFTWEHSNLEVNKPKNRYANVIAYDHSRVLLSAIEGKKMHILFKLLFSRA